MFTLLKVVRTLRSPVIRITADMAKTLPLIVRILLEVGRMRWLVLCIKLAFTLSFVLVVFELVGLEVLLLYHVGTRSSLSNSSTCVLCSRLLFNIKGTNEICNGKLLSLVFQGSSKIVPRRWKLGNDASGNTHLKYSSSFASDCIS